MFAGKEWGDKCTIVIDDTEGSAGIKPKGFTIIFRDDEGNVISEKEYISGETIIIPEAPVKEGYTFIGWGDVVIDKAVTNMTFIAQYEVTPKVTITMDDTYTDGSSIALNATKTETVTGELSFTTDLASDIAHIIDNVLIFDKHYEGTINILASALDKHSNIQSDSKTITVSCDVADTVECEITNVTADDVEADATSAIIKYDCNVTTTKHDGTSNTVVAHKEKTVTFEVNESEEDVTRSGSFVCEHGETVEWSVVQKGHKEPIPSDNEIWYKTNNSVVIVPQNMSPTTNEYTTKGIMTFASNVTSIANNAFKSKSALTEFYGGMSLTSVGPSAFEGCSSLTSIDLPSCISVGVNAFYSCSSLTSVNLPNCTSVGDRAFYKCLSLTSIDLPSCISVGVNAFASCQNLSKFTGLMATEDNRCLMSNGTIYAFAPSGLTSYAREDCTTVGSYAFYYCTSLTSVNFPNCTTVSDDAFYSCSSLTSVNLPSCTIVSAYAFSSCTSLTSVNLPNCTIVGSGVFKNCSKLTSIDLPNCSYITYSAFDGCTSLINVNLPSCSYIGENTFNNCSNLTSIDLPNCTAVSYNVFYSCSSLTSVNLPKCSHVGSNVFRYCYSLTSINLPNCKSVGSGAFGYCSTLTTVTLGAATMCSIGNSNVFTGCTRLTSIYVTASLVNTYKANTIWSWFADKIVPIA